MDDNGSEKEPVPVYISLVTFKSAIQSLRDHGLPPKIDRSAFGSRSGADQRQIMSAFRFLGLIDENEKTQPILSKLVHDATDNSEEEKQILAEILKSKYSKVFELDLKTATPNQLSEALSSYGSTGETTKRCKRFFIKAAEYCGIELSKRLSKGKRTRGEAIPTTSANGTAQKSRRRKRLGNTQPRVEQNNEKPSGNAVKTVSLRHTGGTLTLSGTFNPFDLDEEERKLVYDIIDLMKKYEQKEKTASE